MPSPRPLTTTHYSILCLLNAQPWSAYEMVGQMQRSVGVIWPRAQSNIYADLKTLAQQGLALTSDESTGKRPRTVYRISARGKRALADWIAQPGAEPSFECEALVKIAFAEASTKEALLAQIDVMQRHAEQRLQLGRGLAEDYLNGGGGLRERLHVSSLMWRFLWEQHEAIAEWAEWARSEVEQWEDTQHNVRGQRRGLAAMRDRLSRSVRGGPQDRAPDWRL